MVAASDMYSFGINQRGDPSTTNLSQAEQRGYVDRITRMPIGLMLGISTCLGRTNTAYSRQAKYVDLSFMFLYHFPLGKPLCLKQDVRKRQRKLEQVHFGGYTEELRGHNKTLKRE